MSYTIPIQSKHHNTTQVQYTFLYYYSSTTCFASSFDHHKGKRVTGKSALHKPHDKI